MRESSAFVGGVFSATLEGGRAGATVTLPWDGVHAVTAEGETFHLPYAKCQLELGGASGKMWFCRLPDRSLTIFCEAPGFGDALAQVARRALGSEIARIAMAARAQGRKTASTWAMILGAVLFTLGGSYLLIRHAGSASITLLPRSLDEKLGELTIENMTLEGRVLDDPVLQKAVSEIVDRLAAKAGKGFKFRVRVVDAPVVNAFALPGGPIVLHTGLLRAAKTPEQVAGVLAHEMAHVTRRHGMQRIVQSVGVIALVQLVFGDVSGLAAVAVEVLREGAINSYSRDQEREADMDGVGTLLRAKIDPKGLAEFFTVLSKKEGKLPSAIGWLGTHPELDQRIADVQAAARRSGTKTFRPFALNWQEVQKRAGATP